MMEMIVAMAKNHVIGRDNQMPWHIPEDLQYFKEHTLGKTIVMGRKTFESIGRPLPGRENIVLTRDRQFHAEGVKVYHEIHSLVAEYRNKPLMIIGGAQIYKLFYPYAKRLYITGIDQSFQGDTYFIDYEHEFRLIESSDRREEQGITYRFTLWERKA
ncbi:MAG: dihydrofolate reductase [Cellulosilyticaceae bacterium]